MILRTHRFPRQFRSLQHHRLLSSSLQPTIMTSYLSRLSPVPAFPSYTGPHKVGTIDVEIPVSELSSPSQAPTDDIATVQFRIFYPCTPDSQSKNVNWLPKPQREYVSAYTRFLGAGNTLADFISYFPRILHYITIPALKNTPLETPQADDGRWPVMIFSHGLGGSRNAYSHLVGSIASHGVIVIAPEHRDGSAPISYIRTPPSSSNPSAKTKKTVDYVKLSHTPSPEVEEGRNAQLKIRLWEIGLIHDALLRIDNGEKLTNLNASSSPLTAFKSQMGVHEPGSITFAGHSFGGATTAQLVKSTFYSGEIANAPASYMPIFAPLPDSQLVKQITPHTPVILLDVWCLPLRAASTRWLWSKPMPCYAPGGPGGTALLAVESQAFYKWSVHLRATKHLLSPDPESDVYDYKGVSQPRFYYPSTSAHLSQSDFGVLFPWFTKKVFAAEEPERVMRLNVRACLQVMREMGIRVGRTCKKDLEMEGDGEGVGEGEKDGLENDSLIFGGEVRGWNFITTDISRDQASEGGEKEMAKEPAEAVVGGELMKEREGTGERL